MLSVQYAIQSIQYLIHTLSDSYVTQSIRYPFHMLSNQLRFIAFIIFNAVFRCPQPKHSPHWLFYSSIKFSVVLSHIQIEFLIMYPIHMLYNPYAIWFKGYPIHMLSDPYAIRSICYPIHTLSDPYISDPYGCSSAEVPINLSRKTIKDKFCEAKLFL